MYKQVDKSALLKHAQSPRSVALVSASLLLLALYLLAGLFWSVAEWWRGPQLAPITANVSAAPSASGSSYNVQALLAVPLFGVPPKVAGPDVAIQQDVKRSSLKIKVLGLVAGPDESGVAVLRHGSKTKAYAIGEKIEVPGSVKLLAVLDDHIIIENNRKQEKIELDERRISGGVTASAAASGAIRDDDVIRLDRPEVVELIGDPRETVRNSPLRLARFFSVSPVSEGSSLIGYSIKPGRDPRLFEVLELTPGDVILSVNGQSVADMPPTELMKMLEISNSFELLVQRNGTILSKRLDI